MAGPQHGTQMVIAVDDTDSLQRGGTGRTARAIADLLGDRYAVRGVTRHQLAVMPGINYTKKNSTNVVHLTEVLPDPDALAQQLCEWLETAAEDEAEPGLCIAGVSQVAGQALGPEAQRRVVTREEIRNAAEDTGVILRHPREGDGGIIGAFAGACLASGQDDGRFVQIGSVREMSGVLSVKDLLRAGVDEVRETGGDLIKGGTICGPRFRPAVRSGRCVLYCTPGPDGQWQPVKGHPDQHRGATDA